MDVTWMGILILICLFIYLTWDTKSRRCNLPPGPAPLPLIGNLLDIKRGNLVNSLMKLWDQYGSVYTLYYGSQPVVVLCGYEAVKEALVDQGEVFGDRGPVPLLQRLTQGYGFSLSNGERWKILRTFTVKTLKSFGFGKKSGESKIQKEAQCVVEEFRKYNGHPVDPTKYLIHALSNVLCAFIFGARFDYKEQRFTKLFEILDNYLYLASSIWGQLLTILPAFMSHVLSLQQRFKLLLKDMLEFVQERVKTSLETLDPTSSRHFIDSFLIKMEEGTVIYPLLCTVHRDPKHYSSPWEFNPNHFLDESGKFKKNDAFLPFSAGKRICPGENLARIELFIFLATILQSFELSSPNKFTETEVTKMQGFLNAPVKFEVSFLPR